MSEKIKVKLKDGKEINGEIVEIESSNELWNEYGLKDGSKIKLKVVVSKIIRTELLDDSGAPIYLINSTNVVDAMVPDNLKVTKTDKNTPVQ